MASPSTVISGRDDEDHRRGRPPSDDLLHDLGQPLAAIRALASAPLPPTGEADAAAEAGARLRRIGELADWMAALLRTSGGPTRRPGSPADAEAVAREVAVSAAAAFRGVLRCRPGGPAPVPLDRLDLRRAVGNVVDNAVRAAGPGGRVEVRVRRDGSTVWVEVEDDGPGFGLVRCQTGHGLAVTLAVVGGCGGAVEFVGGRARGALVRLELPLAAPDHAA